ncbi:hypothetical protein QJS10_CPA09g00519 [Acorus calamus]|uniref:Uncharacterized protein n=1 Tax=Acorus calamus TaxID=4465 RepID=A0AAV9E861_ACOCL|nr:hypothetical protein QJS10_CPA09g00519 [Acorus calamus]
MAEKKEELLRRSRNGVAFAWTLVALCCWSHASHSIGIHSAHGRASVGGVSDFISTADFYVGISCDLLSFRKLAPVNGSLELEIDNAAKVQLIYHCSFGKTKT